MTFYETVLAVMAGVMLAPIAIWVFFMLVAIVFYVAAWLVAFVVNPAEFIRRHF